jgi:hypothetical protein
MTSASDVDRQVDCDGVAYVEGFGLADVGLDGDDVLRVLRVEGRRPGGVADLSGDGDHAPAVGDGGGRRLQHAAVVLGDGDEVPRCRAFPEPQLPAELQIHPIRIGGGSDFTTNHRAVCRSVRDDRGVVHKRKSERVNTFAEIVRNEVAENPGSLGQPMTFRSPIADREYVDERGRRWRLRGGELRVRRAERLVLDPLVPVVHVYLDQISDVATEDRKDFLAKIRPYLDGTAPREDHTDFVAAEFKDGDGRSLVVVEESC